MRAYVGQVKFYHVNKYYWDKDTAASVMLDLQNVWNQFFYRAREVTLIWTCVFILALSITNESQTFHWAC